MCFFVDCCMSADAGDKKGRSLWQHPWLSSWLVSESPTCLPSYPISENRDSPVCIFQASLPLLILPQTSWNSRVCSKDDSAVDWKNMVKVWNTNLISAVRTQPLPNKQTNNQACLAAEHDGWGPRNDPQKGCYASSATVDPNPYPYHVRQLFLGLTFENFHFLGFQVLPENSTDLFDHQYP